ncbi:MAG: DNA cytosine methyltransferase, partial [Bacteroidota bacterium]
SAPPLILVENVPGWLSSNGGADFRATIQALNDLGYSCDVFLLDALRFTPQSRRRVFLVGSRKPMEQFNLNTILHRSDALSSDRLKACIVANSDLNWMSLTIPEPPPLLRDGLAKNVIEKLHPRDKRWWSEKEVERHLGMMANSHLKTVLELQDRSRTSYKTFYRRRRSGKQRAEMRTDDIAGCLRTAVGGSSRQFLVVAGNGKVRMRNMTSREYARLQGVPDDYTFDIEERHALTGFGDAVCVPAIAWIANNVLTPLTKTLSATTTQIAQPARVSMPA